MKKIIILALFLSGCNSAQLVTTEKYTVVKPDQSMYNCPVIKQWPKWNTLKDSEVARLVVELHKNNLTCKSSIESIRTFLDKADETLKKGG